MPEQCILDNTIWFYFLFCKPVIKLRTK